jgi:hypothetical protein
MPKKTYFSDDSLTVGMIADLKNDFWAQKFPLNSF